MNCRRLENVMMEYLDGVLDAGERAHVESHLASCTDCQARVEGFRRVSQALESWETPETSPWFNARLRRRIAAYEASRWDWRAQFRFLLKPSYAAAMATMIVAGSIALWNVGPGPAPSPVITEHQRVQHQKMEEIIPLVDDYEILANFEVLTDLKEKDTL